MIDIRRGEHRVLACACLFHFFILFGYFLLRPARESLGMRSGVEQVVFLFLGTLLVTALLNAPFAWAVTTLPRRRVVIWTYRTFMLVILAFGFVFLLRGTGGSAPDTVTIWLSRSYYVLVTVFALFNTMVFWAVMTDSFDRSQAVRLFPLVAIGGTLGALVGSSQAWAWAEEIGTAWLLLCSIPCFEAAILAFKGLPRVDRTSKEEAPVDRAIGGSPMAGLVHLVRTPYLLGIGGYILLMTITGTFLYFTQLRIVEALQVPLDEQTSLFATVNMASQGATLLIQLLVTASLLRVAGAGWTLAVLPVISLGAFGALLIAPTFLTIVIGNAFFSAGRFGFAKPARETLFTVIPREDRYKSKAIIDTFVYRTGDVIGATGYSGIQHLVSMFAMRTIGSTVGAVAVLAAPLGIIWIALAFWLGKARRHRAEAMAFDHGT